MRDENVRHVSWGSVVDVYSIAYTGLRDNFFGGGGRWGRWALLTKKGPSFLQ